MLDILCETFGCTPDVAVDLDEERALTVMQARHARYAAAAFEAKSASMTDGQTRLYKRMLDALDAAATRRGVPEEL